MNTNIQNLRINAGFKSAREFAETSGIKLSTYTNYEKDSSRIPLENAVKIANALNCTLDDLAGRDTNQGKIENLTKFQNNQEYVLRHYKLLNENDRRSVNKIILALSSLS